MERIRYADRPYFGGPQLSLCRRSSRVEEFQKILRHEVGQGGLEPVEVTVDRPFVFLIRGTETSDIHVPAAWTGLCRDRGSDQGGAQEAPIGAYRGASYRFRHLPCGSGAAIAPVSTAGLPWVHGMGWVAANGSRRIPCRRILHLA